MQIPVWFTTQMVEDVLKRKKPDETIASAAGRLYREAYLQAQTVDLNTIVRGGK